MLDNFSESFKKGFKIGFFGYFAVAGLVTINRLQVENQRLLTKNLLLEIRNGSLRQKIKTLKGS